MQADRVFDIVTESLHDNKLVSAAEAWRTSARERVSRPPEAEKLSWTQAAKTKQWTFNDLDFKRRFKCFTWTQKNHRFSISHSASFTYSCWQLSLLWRNKWVEKSQFVAKQSAEARFLLWERLPHKHTDPPLEDKTKTKLSQNCFHSYSRYKLNGVYHDLTWK